LGSPNLWRITTVVLIAIVLAITFSGVVARDQFTRGVFPAVAGGAAILLAAAFGIPWLLRPFRFTLAKHTPWLVGALSLVAVSVPLLLWIAGRTGLGSQWMKSFRIQAAPPGFGDLRLPLDWLSCAAQGLDPFTDSLVTCAEAGPMNYGPGFLWLTQLPMSAQTPVILGFLAIIVSSLALVWLSRASHPRGALALLLCAVSPAWFLLLERGNIDQAILWSAIALVVIVQWKPTLFGWTLAAIPIWILGSWKYYPFAMVMAFLPAMKLRRGWIVPTAFVLAAIIYLFVFRETVSQGLQSNAEMVGGIGRESLATFIDGAAVGTQQSLWAHALVWLMCLSAFMWGISNAPIRNRLTQAPGANSGAMLAMAGATMLLATLLLGGFGYLYKAAFLLLALPMLSRIGGKRQVVSWQSSTTMILLIVMAMTVTSNPLLGSVSALVAASFVFGFALIELLRPSLPERDASITNPSRSL
jgi:hypothetical protein